MDRRSFLAAGAASLAAASLSSATAKPSSRRFRKALKLSMVAGDAPLVETFRMLRDLGFEGVEPDAPGGPDADTLRRASDATGLEIPGVVDSVHWRNPLNHSDPAVRAEGRRALEEALGTAARVGASSVLLVPAVVNGDHPYDEAWERSREEILRVLPVAEETGVRIAIENVWNGFLLSPLEAAAYIDSFESPLVGWHLDVGNVVNFGWPEQWVRILGARILKIDVKDFSRRKRDAEGLWKGFDVAIGEGDVDWAAVRAALTEIGYSGWASAEVPGGDREHLAEISRRMDVVLSPDG